MLKRYSETYPQGKPQIIRAAIRRAAVVSLYRLGPDGTATLESQVVRSRARSHFLRRA